MSLSSGARLGAYEVLLLIGEGGMGQVFRARDLRLKRDVAIKALSTGFARDGERAARLRREAEALAALSHPHIAAIYDLLEVEGSLYLVLELVEGETIADRLRNGPLAIGESVAIARQIAHALEAAHARGIVHRDLKPANIKIRPDGTVKVLDFGLAKAAPASSGDDGRTVTAPAMTTRGMVVGTAGYMSPEQARGQQVGPQTDIWALGCVLFEMLSARSVFQGDTATDLLAAVTRDDVDWTALPRATPPGVRAVLRRSLERDLSRRFHHVADVRIALEDVDAAEIPTVPPPARRSAAAWWAVAATAAAAMAIVAAVWSPARTAPPAMGREMRLELRTPPSHDPLSVAVSPDGTKVVFAALDDGPPRLWIRALNESQARPLTGTELATAPFWSPDSRSIAFFADGYLKRLDLAGSLTRNLAAAPVNGRGGAWNGAGQIVYSPSAVGGLFKVSANGGEAVAVSRLADQQSSHRWPVFLPDDRHFLFYTRGTPEARGIFLGSVDGDTPRRLVEADALGAVLDDHLLFVRRGTLFAQPFDPETYTLSREPFAITDQVAVDPAVNRAAVTTAAGGVLVFRTGGTTGERQLTWFDRTGRIVGTVGDADATAFLNPDLSPDGRSIVLDRNVEAYQDIWVIEASRGVWRRLTFDAAIDQIPVFGPDGRVVFTSNRRGPYDLYERMISGTDDRVLLASPQNKFPMGFSGDGRFLLYRNTADNANFDLWALPLAGDRTPIPVATTPFQEVMADFSADGRWVAFQSNESGQYQIVLQSFPDPGDRIQISANGGSQPRWRRDGRELFYIALDGRLTAVPLTADGRGRPSPQKAQALFSTLTPGGPVPIPQKQQYVVSSDGQRFLVNRLTDAAATSPIAVIVNWRSHAVP